MKKLTVCGLFFLAQVAFGANLSVQPLYFDFKAGKAPSEDFTIIVKSDKPANVRASLYQAEQKITGKLDFKQVGKEKASELIKLKRDAHRFTRPGTWRVEGTINYPTRVNKTFAYALMIEEELPMDKKGVNISVRYAVVLKVQTSKNRVYERGTLSAGELFSADNKLFYKSLFENDSVKDYRVQSYLTIRNKDGALVERADLKTLSAWQKQASSSIVMPGAEVELVGQLKKPLPKGEYTAQVIAKMNGKRQLISKNDISIKEELHQERVDEKAKALLLTPGKINVEYKENRPALFRFKVDNPTDEVVTVELPKAVMDAKHGSYKFMPQKLSIQPGKSKTAIFKAVKKSGDEWNVGTMLAPATTASGSKLEPLKLPITFEVTK